MDFSGSRIRVKKNTNMSWSQGKFGKKSESKVSFTRMEATQF